MISSRWPRPIGIIESIAFSPVCIGSSTGWRWTTPGALNSAGRVSVVLMSPLSSSGRPSGSTRRPSSSSPTGISSSLLGALDGVALDDLVPVAEQHGADVVGLEVQRQADDVVRQLEHLERHAVVEPVDAGDPVADLEHGADLGEVRRAGVHALDPLREDASDLVRLDLHVAQCLLVMSYAAAATFFRSLSKRLRMLASRTMFPTCSTRPPRMSVVDVALQLDRLAGLLLDLLADALARPRGRARPRWSRSPRGACSPSPRASSKSRRIRKITGIRCFSISSSRKLTQLGLGPARSPCRAPPSSRSRRSRG